LIEIVALGVAVIVAVASVAQAVRDHSLEPVWTVGWLPAVLVATIGRPHARRRCSVRERRRSHS
jgi:hypothetical protein